MGLDGDNIFMMLTLLDNAQSLLSEAAIDAGRRWAAPPPPLLEHVCCRPSDRMANPLRLVLQDAPARCWGQIHLLLKFEARRHAPLLERSSCASAGPATHGS